MVQEDTWERIDDPHARLKHQTNVIVNEIVLNKGYPLVSGIGNTIFYRAADAMCFPILVDDVKGRVGTRRYVQGKAIETWLDKHELGQTSDMCVPWSVDNFTASFGKLAEGYYTGHHAFQTAAEFHAQISRRKEEFREYFKTQVWRDIEEYGEGVLWCDGYRLNRSAHQAAIDRIWIPAYVQSMEFGGEANGPINPIELFKIKEWYSLKQKTMPRANAIDAFVKGIFLAHLIDLKGYSAKYISHESLEVACVSVGTQVLDPWLSAPQIELTENGHPRNNTQPKWHQY